MCTEALTVFVLLCVCLCLYLRQRETARQSLIILNVLAAIEARACVQSWIRPYLRPAVPLCRRCSVPARPPVSCCSNFVAPFATNRTTNDPERSSHSRSHSHSHPNQYQSNVCRLDKLHSGADIDLDSTSVLGLGLAAAPFLAALPLCKVISPVATCGHFQGLRGGGEAELLA